MAERSRGTDMKKCWKSLLFLLVICLIIYAVFTSSHLASHACHFHSPHDEACAICECLLLLGKPFKMVCLLGMLLSFIQVLRMLRLCMIKEGIVHHAPSLITLKVKLSN